MLTSREVIWQMTLDPPSISRAGDGVENILSLRYEYGNDDERARLRCDLVALISDLCSGSRMWHAGVKGLLLAADPILLSLGDREKERLCFELRDFLESTDAGDVLDSDLAFLSYQVILVCGVSLNIAFWASAQDRYGADLLSVSIAGLALHGIAPLVDFLSRSMPNESVALIVLPLLPGLAETIGNDGARQVALLIASSLGGEALLDLHDLIGDLSGIAYSSLESVSGRKDEYSENPTGIDEALIEAGDLNSPGQRESIAALSRSLEALTAVTGQAALGQSVWQEVASSAERAATAVAAFPPSALVDQGYRALLSSIGRLLVAVSETTYPVSSRAVGLLARSLPTPESVNVLRWAVATGRLENASALQVLREHGLHAAEHLDTATKSVTPLRDLLPSIERSFLPIWPATNDGAVLVVRENALPRSHKLLLQRFGDY